MSWLNFNERVLALAEDRDQPLLERAKFLAIFASNLDEFYMVRVAGLKRRREMGLSVVSADGLTPTEQLSMISASAQQLVERQGRCFVEDVLPALVSEDIRIVQRQISPELVPRRLRRLLPVVERLAGWNLILKARKPVRA